MGTVDTRECFGRADGGNLLLIPGNCVLWMICDVTCFVRSGDECLLLKMILFYGEQMSLCVLSTIAYCFGQTINTLPVGSLIAYFVHSNNFLVCSILVRFVEKINVPVVVNKVKRKKKTSKYYVN